MAEPRGKNLLYYKGLFDTLQILPGKEAQVISEVARIKKNQDLYLEAQAHTGKPWYFFALTHEMECDGRRDRQIFNGQRWDRTTTIVPKGYGPWPSWGASAVDAIKVKRLEHVDMSTVPALLAELERWNGGGYMRRGKHSPYLWAGSNHGKDSGYYTSDGKYDPFAQSKQIGAAVLLWWMKKGDGK